MLWKADFPEFDANNGFILIDQ